MKLPLFELNQKLNVENDGGKVNLSFFGQISVGKTTIINLMIRHLIIQRTNKHYIRQAACSNNNPNKLQEEKEDQESEEEEKEEEFDGYLKLTTKEIENTYFISFIENSNSKAYEVILEVNSESDRVSFSKIKALEKIKYDYKNQITLKFSNNESEIKSLNKLLYDIDYQSFLLIRSRKKGDFNLNQKNQLEIIPSKMIIKIPDFPKEFRLIDCPGMSTPSFRKAFIKTLNNLNSINFYLIVNDIYARESYSMTEDIVKEVTNDFGSPNIYYFITKGNKFLNEFPKINSNYKAYVRVNSMKLKNLEESKTKINFRKVIPINDKDYNEDVKKCLNFFFNDLDKIKNECRTAYYDETIMFKLRRIIQDMMNSTTKDLILSQEQIKALQINADKVKSEFEKELHNYFSKFTNLNRFINYFPDFHDELFEMYNRYEESYYQFFYRDNYKESLNFSKTDFQKIILRKPQKLAVFAFNKIFYEVSKDIRDKLLYKLKIEGLINANSESMEIGELLLFLTSNNLIPISPMKILLSLIELLSINPGPYYPGEQIVKVQVPFEGTIKVRSFIWFLFNFKTRREEMTEGLLEILNQNIRKIIQESLDRFENLKTKIFNYLFDYKVLEDLIKDLYSECDKFKPNNKHFSNANYKEEFLSIIENKRLKNFFEKVFANEEAE